MSELSETEFVLQMARAVVVEVEPEELALFPLMAEAYVQSPKSLLTHKAAGEAEPGMGEGERVATWTPTIFVAPAPGSAPGRERGNDREYGVMDAKAQQIAECVVGKWATKPVSEGGER
jgi:hypothetical protein